MKTKTRLIALTLVLAALAAGSLQTEARNIYWGIKSSLYHTLGCPDNAIVMLGNSITDNGEWTELLKNPRVVNRGIGGDTVDGILERLGDVTAYSPDKIFLLIGVNDISHRLSAQQIGAEYERLVKRIRTESPSTRLYIQSVMPINNSFGKYRSMKGKERVIPELNEIIKQIAADNGATYIDLWPALADSEGKLRKELTNDGLHLMGPGYAIWAEVLKPYVNE